MQKYKVIISRRATDMLKEHILFLAQVDKAAAIKTKNKLIEAFKTLELKPSKYPFFNQDYIAKKQVSQDVC